MNLYEALRVMNESVRLTGQSDIGLVQEVEEEADRLRALRPGLQAKPLSIARGLDASWVRVRPVDALQRLARATALDPYDDVFDSYQRWAKMRYLGAFDTPGDLSGLRLSEAAGRSRGNQRRVMSEELGVGFGVLLAEFWCEAMGADGPVAATDVDLALQDDNLELALRPGQQRQPDYLLEYPNPLNPQERVFKLVECKGTGRANYAVAQLARASTQLSALLVNGRPIQGLAVSTVSTDRDVQFLAVDPDDREQSRRLDDEDLTRARFEPPRVLKRAGQIFVGDDFYSAAVVTSLGTLAEYSGNPELAEKWLPREISSKRPSKRPPERAFLETIEGDFVGQEMWSSLPGQPGRLRIFQGVEREVESALQSDSATEAKAAQVRFSQRNKELRTRQPSPAAPEDAVTSVSSEGAILSISIE